MIAYLAKTIMGLLYIQYMWYNNDDGPDLDLQYIMYSIGGLYNVSLTNHAWICLCGQWALPHHDLYPTLFPIADSALSSNPGSLIMTNLT